MTQSDVSQPEPSRAQAPACPFDRDFLADPFAGYARLRQEGPVHRVALPDGSPAWLVLGEAEVRAGLADPRLSVDRSHSTGGYQGFSLPPALDANLLNLDGEDHLRLRRLVSQGFTPRHVEKLRGRVQAEADRLADVLAERMAAEGSADLVAHFSHPLPLAVIGDLLGVPPADRPAFAGWTATMLVPDDPRQIPEAVRKIHRYLVDLVAARRDAPGDDLLSHLIAVRDGHDEGTADNRALVGDEAANAANDSDHRDRLTENELVSLAFLILLAGSENAQHLISGGLLTLLRHPAQLAELRADSGLMPGTVEELLRYVNANQMAIRRFATEPLEIGGTRIPRGDTLMLALAAAHRDPARYPDPDTFDLHRADKAHLALGQGMHYCLGAPLARMEIEIALTTLLRRFPNLELAAPAEDLARRATFRTYALGELPVRG